MPTPSGRGRGRSDTAPEALEVVQKRVTALEMRKAGATFESIAQALGYADKSGAYRAVETALRETVQHPADDLRRLELERLDALTLAMWPLAQAGKYPAVLRLVQISQRRARLLGLDAPTRQEHTGPNGGPIAIAPADLAELSDDELEEEIARLARLGGVEGGPGALPAAARGDDPAAPGGAPRDPAPGQPDPGPHA